jgi:hypothetical protein
MHPDLELLLIAVSAGETISCPKTRKRLLRGHRREGRHPLRRPSRHGHHQRPPLSGGCPQAASHFCPELPKQPGYHKRRRRLSEAIGWRYDVLGRARVLRRRHIA